MSVRLNNVSHSYGDHVALDDVSLSVAPGELVALLGPNGAGKSTLVEIAAGLLRPSGGTVAVDGAIGLAPQELGLYPSLTVRQNLIAFGEFHGLGRRAARQRAGDLLEPLALEELAGRACGQLSGGEQRRVHAALALVHRPKVVLLDEPTAGADTQTRARILDVVRGLADDGAAVLYTTHYLAEVETLAAGVALIEGGRLLLRLPLAEVVAAHADSVVILSFAERVPDHLRAIAGAVLESEVTVRVPGDDVRGLLLGLDTESLAGVELVRPSLEAAYLALTGRRANR